MAVFLWHWVMGEWLHYLKMQEWLLLLPLMWTGFRQALIMWILWCAKFCEGKLQLFQSWWAESPPSIGLFPWNLEEFALKPLHFYPIWLQSTWKFKSKAKVGKKPLMCNKILTHCATTQSFTSRENSLVTKLMCYWGSIHSSNSKETNNKKP